MLEHAKLSTKVTRSGLSLQLIAKMGAMRAGKLIGKIILKSVLRKGASHLIRGGFN